MAWVLLFLVSTCFVCFLVVWFINWRALRRLTKELEELKAVQPSLQLKFDGMMQNGRAALEKEASDVRVKSNLLMTQSKLDADHIKSEAKLALNRAYVESNTIIDSAKVRANQIREDSRKIEEKADSYQLTVIAMKNILDGYGNEYLIPTSSLLDNLADEFSHKQAGQELKTTRKHTKTLIKTGYAAECDYVEAIRREGAIAFVLDAFNGKIDSVMSKVRHDNAGKLAQEIKDAFELVNHGGLAFRNARITPLYLTARLEELRWAAITQELKMEEREEQRRIREQIREEEKARREFAKAIKETEKEEQILKKAMEKAQRLAAEAGEDQRAKFEQQLAELENKLLDAEERNKRAVSMAQTTRKGHVYVISNIGSFGENIYKIGLTRRLEPLDRVKELGDSSVPFRFDIHALIPSDDAPALETRLHKHFVMKQVNKVNHRKEFFRATLADIREEIEAIGIQVKWTMLSEAREYKETLAIEKMIESDPVVREQWQSKQLTLDPIDFMELNASIE